MASVRTYPLEQFRNMIFQGFDHTLPSDVIECISSIAVQVGSPDYIKTPVFKKREPTEPKPQKVSKFKKKQEEAWNFQATKIETKTGIQADLDQIRANINKLTDKNYAELSNKTVALIRKMVGEYSEEELLPIGHTIFEIASSNRYYSPIYADLYTKITEEFSFIRVDLSSFSRLFETIVYVDPNENYDKFCENNKISEKRKALAMFYVNLMHRGVIPKETISKIASQLLETVIAFISIENKKHEVDEMTDIIVILCKDNKNDTNNTERILRLASYKTKDYLSFTTKSLFCYMDLAE